MEQKKFGLAGIITSLMWDAGVAGWPGNLSTGWQYRKIVNGWMWGAARERSARRFLNWQTLRHYRGSTGLKVLWSLYAVVWMIPVRNLKSETHSPCRWRQKA